MFSPALNLDPDSDTDCTGFTDKKVIREIREIRV